jgi:hypothetical protein
VNVKRDVIGLSIVGFGKVELDLTLVVRFDDEPWEDRFAEREFRR